MVAELSSLGRLPELPSPAQRLQGFNNPAGHDENTPDTDATMKPTGPDLSFEASPVNDVALAPRLSTIRTVTLATGMLLTYFLGVSVSSYENLLPGSINRISHHPDTENGQRSRQDGA